MKSNIKWDNHIMRKYGQSIRRNIEAVARRTILHERKAILREVNKAEYGYEKE